MGGCCASTQSTNNVQVKPRRRSSLWQSSATKLRENYWSLQQHSLPAWHDASASSKSLKEKQDAIRTTQGSFRMILAGEASRFRAMERFHTDLTPLSFFFNQFFCHLAVLRPSAKIFTRTMLSQSQYLRVVLMMPIQKMLELDGDQKVDFDHLLEELTADTVAVSERLGLTSCYQFVDCYVAAYGALSTCLSADFMPVAEAWQTFFSILIDSFRERLADSFFTQAIDYTDEQEDDNDGDTSCSYRQSMMRQLLSISLTSPQAQEMQPMVWTDEASVGFPWLDADHQWLYTMVTALYKAIKNNLKDGIDSVLAVASGLIDYTISHFGAEEAVFVEHNLDEAYIKNHKAEHDKFVDIVRDARGKLSKLQSYLQKAAPITDKEREHEVHLPGHLFDHNVSPRASSSPSVHAGNEPEIFDLVMLYIYLRNWLHLHVRISDQEYCRIIFGKDACPGTTFTGNARRVTV